MNGDMLAELSDGITELAKRTQYYKDVLGDSSSVLKNSYTRSVGEATMAMKGQLGALKLLDSEFRNKFIPDLKSVIRESETHAAVMRTQAANMKRII